MLFWLLGRQTGTVILAQWDFGGTGEVRYELVRRFNVLRSDCLLSFLLKSQVRIWYTYLRDV